eukprot:TRINITY_DN11676_c0_g1_i3.p1 TRINITY_DN11676_c0_g1~~TRINITY_DN11676_c0_g1_i3.p1  ORF type:complete len:336 (-),score=69.83 TRINITY_DN11676_c0_g1_i3:106-1113(-)
MKVLSKDEMIKKNKVQRVLTEREILLTTDHPFIVSMYYSFQSRNKLVFIMQYCAGGEFLKLIQSQPYRCLTEEQAKFYICEVILAIEYLHMCGYVYRDLKPENILVHECGHILLTDFDLSKVTTPGTPKVVSSLPGLVVAEPELVTNSFVGTEEYLAPEVINGTGHNAAVDWWALGILLYEMLYSTTPFRGTTRDATFSNIINTSTKLKLPPAPRGSISKECKNLLKLLLHRDPKKRLGASWGAAEIKEQAFFKGVKWQLVRNQTPPIKPDLIVPALDPTCFKNVRLKEIRETHDEESEIDVAILDQNHPFKTCEPVDKTERDDLDRQKTKQKKT